MADEVANSLRLFRILEQQSFDLSQFNLELNNPPPKPPPFIPPEPDLSNIPSVTDQSNISPGISDNGGTSPEVIISLSDTAEDFLTVTQARANKKGFTLE